MKDMRIRKSEAREKMEEWEKNGFTLPPLEADEQNIRETFHEFDKTVKEQNTAGSDYFRDVHMGLAIYNYLMQQPWFSQRKASDDDFWRYIAIEIMPDLVGDRWGNTNDDHYWRVGARIWPRQIWWYVNLSWQGDLENTTYLLDSDNFSTDTIINLEERTGRDGTYIEVYRSVMYYYANLDKNRIISFNANLHKTDKHGTLFRTIMKLHTVKSIVVEPELYLGGVDGYAKSLFAEAGVDIDVT